MKKPVVMSGTQPARTHLLNQNAITTAQVTTILPHPYRRSKNLRWPERATGSRISAAQSLDYFDPAAAEEISRFKRWLFSATDASSSLL